MATARKIERLIIDSLTPDMLKKMEQQFPEPVVKVNGKEIQYDSFQELKDSSHYRMMLSLMRFLGAAGEINSINRYIDMKIEEEQASVSD